MEWSDLMKSSYLESPTKGELYQSIDMDEAEKVVSRTLEIFDHIRYEREAHTRVAEARLKAAIERVERQQAAELRRAS